VSKENLEQQPTISSNAPKRDTAATSKQSSLGQDRELRDDELGAVTGGREIHNNMAQKAKVRAAQAKLEEYS
jgi:hypothetical protein